MAAATIVHDTSEAVELCPPYGLYLKPITKMTISVALPQLKQPGKSISNWEVMERLKGMVHHHQFSTLRISKSTMDFIRFEGEVENKSLVSSFLACLDGKTIKLSGFSDILRVRAAEFKIDFPTRHDWDSFFRDAKDMNETLPGERPDTIHLEGLPCKWFALKESGSEKPSEEVLVRVFERFGEIRNVDIPMLDPYREEMTGRNFHTFSFGGHLNFEAYVQYREYAGFIQAMSALRGMKLMYKGEDGKAVACNVKVSFDSTKHLSDASIKKRQLERQKLQELEQQREAQKRREKEAEERQRAEESSLLPELSCGREAEGAGGAGAREEAGGEAAQAPAEAKGPRAPPQPEAAGEAAGGGPAGAAGAGPAGGAQAAAGPAQPAVHPAPRRAAGPRQGREAAGARAAGGDAAAAAAGGAPPAAGGGAAASGGGEGARAGPAAPGARAARAPAQHPAQQEGRRAPPRRAPARLARAPAAAGAGHSAHRVGRLRGRRSARARRPPRGPAPAAARRPRAQRERTRRGGGPEQGGAESSPARPRRRPLREEVPRRPRLHPRQQPAAQGRARRLRPERAQEGCALRARQVQP
nr:A-kinase anchor protein 17A isoform X2 [Kogia breviceps]